MILNPGNFDESIMSHFVLILTLAPFYVIGTVGEMNLDFYYPFKALDEIVELNETSGILFSRLTSVLHDGG